MRKVIKIKPETVERVKQFLAQGISQRDTGLRLNVSQYTVFHISKGRYDDYEQPLVKEGKYKGQKSFAKKEFVESEFFEHDPFYVRY